MFGITGTLTITREVVPPLLVILADDVSQKAWLSLINTEHGGAYTQNTLSFSALQGKRTNLSWAYVYGRCYDRKFNVTVYKLSPRSDGTKPFRVAHALLSLVTSGKLWCLFHSGT